MRKKKQLELFRKRNTQLNKKIDDLQFKIDFDQKSNQNDKEYTKSLIADLERIKKEWTAALEDLHEKQDEYKLLVNDLKNFRKTVVGENSKKTWFKRILKRKRGIAI